MESNNEAKVQRLMSTISSNTQRISQNANQVSAMIQQFGTPRDSLEHREKTFELVRSTGQIAKDTFKQIKDLSNYSQIINRDKQLKIQQDRLTDVYTKSLRTLQDNEKKLAAQKPLSTDNTTLRSNQNDIQLIDIDNNQSDYRASFTNNQAYEQQQRQMQLQEDDKLRAVQEQNNALQNLEKDIVDVNSIFKDLAILVHDQGEVIDSIEKNIEQTQVTVKEANVQLTSAVKYQSKARRKKLCLVLIAIVVLAILGIVIYFSIPKSKK